MESVRSIYLLKKFIANTSTLEELKETERLFSEGVDDKIWMQVLAEHEKTFSSSQKFSSSPKVQERLAKIRLHILTISGKPSKRYFPLQRKLIPWAAVAATLLIALVSYPQLRNIVKQNIFPVKQELLSVGQQTQKVNTPDGSEIWINSNSTFKYPSEFSNKQREVILEGQGFFNVKKNPDKPFVVHAGNLKIKVLGTSFDVQSYRQEEEVIVTLATGKIEIELASEKPAQKAVLIPGEQFVYNKSLNKYTIKNVDPYTGYAWKDGLLLFDQQPLSKIAKALERSYGVVFVFENRQLGNEKITFRGKNENLDNIMEILSFTAGFSYSVDGKKITISY